MSNPQPTHRETQDHSAASEWFVRLRSEECDASMRAAFEDWMAASPSHRLAYAELAAAAWAVEQSGALLKPVDQPEVRRRPVARRTITWARLMVALLGLGILWTLPLERWWDDSRADWVSERGDVLQLQLEDGTRLWLSADSAVSQDFDDTGRRLQLLRGAAYVQVVSDPDRPFVIEAGTLSATALGTRYAVSRYGMDRVEVEEGRVAVTHADSTTELVAGEALDCDTDSCAPQAVSADEVAAWREGMLRFENAALSEVIEVLGSHTARPVLVLASVDPNALVTAVVPGTDAEAALRAICQRHGLRLQQWGPWLIVRA